MHNQHNTTQVPSNTPTSKGAFETTSAENSPHSMPGSHRYRLLTLGNGWSCKPNVSGRPAESIGRPVRVGTRHDVGQVLVQSTHVVDWYFQAFTLGVRFVSRNKPYVSSSQVLPRQQAGPQGLDRGQAAKGRTGRAVPQSGNISISIQVHDALRNFPPAIPPRRAGARLWRHMAELGLEAMLQAMVRYKARDGSLAPRLYH